MVEPSVQEIAETMGISKEVVEEMKMWYHDTLSIDKPIGEGQGYTLEDALTDENVILPEDAVCSGMLKEHIDEILETLTEEEAIIISQRYGLNGERCKTLEEVGKRYGFTRERGRQIEGRVLRKIRSIARKKELDEMLN